MVRVREGGGLHLVRPTSATFRSILNPMTLNQSELCPTTPLRHACTGHEARRLWVGCAHTRGGGHYEGWALVLHLEPYPPGALQARCFEGITVLCQVKHWAL